MLRKFDPSSTHQPQTVRTWRRRQIWISRLAYLGLLVLPVIGLWPGPHAGAQLRTDQPAGTHPQTGRVINEDAKNAIPGQYLVIFKPGTGREAIAAAQQAVERSGGKIEFRYTSSIIGFSAKIDAKTARVISAMRGVDYVENDQTVSLETVQNNPPKGLDRTSERWLTLDNRYTYAQDGTGVNAYVIDTGILATHNDFGGRASGASFTAISDGNGANDCHGHGTHVAGTIGGTTYGIAKNVQLHAVRVLSCSGSGAVSGVIAGVDWVTMNAVRPAVANMSLGGGASPALDTSVTNSIASNVTYAIAAGNSTADACNTSPARVPTAMTVGAVDPSNDTRPGFSNYGSCVDLFAPGVGILSASITANNSTATLSGTSMASPHVAGVAALYLQNHATHTPAQVWGRILFVADVSTTPNWSGVINPGPGSPNVLLHWGSRNNGYDDGDPHLKTVDGTYYDFQSAGEFVALRDGSGTEIQTRQTPVATSFSPGANPHTGLATCVSLNTAVAARVGRQRVTFQPNLSGVPDPSGMQLRVDGVVTALGTNGVAVGPGGRVSPSVGGGIQIDFPDGTTLIATPGWWASQSRWYLNISVFHTPASEGIMGVVPPGSWLPALPDGSSVGSLPSTLPQRYAVIYGTFADEWRVTRRTSLFDYAPGTSTATFTIRNWPALSGQCTVPANPPVKPIEPREAQQLCRPVTGKEANANCVFDVTVTGEAGFAKTYQLSQQVRAGSTAVSVNSDRNSSLAGEPVTFTASVELNTPGGQERLTGMVQFIVDGKAGESVQLDAQGRANWMTSGLKPGAHQIAAQYFPSREGAIMGSTGGARTHLVKAGGKR